MMGPTPRAAVGLVVGTVLLALGVAQQARADSRAGAWEEPVRQALVSLVAERLGVSAGDVSVPWLGLGRPLSCPPNATVQADASRGETFRGHMDVRVAGVVDGAVCDELRLRPSVVVWQTVPVAARSVPAGERVPLVWARVRRDQIDGVTVPDTTLELAARVGLSAGQAVTWSRVEAIPDAHGGDPVVIVAARRGLRIEAEGRLMNDARLGDPVHVVNLATGVVVRGRLVAPGTVRTGGGG